MAADAFVRQVLQAQVKPHAQLDRHRNRRHRHRRVIPAIQAEPRSRLYGLVTRDPAKACPFGVRVWASLDEALADPRVHAVYVGTPVFLHAPQTIQSLRAGKHVLCEKPMAMNEAEARTMLQAAEMQEWQDFRRRLLSPLLIPRCSARSNCSPRARSESRCSPNSLATDGLTAPAAAVGWSIPPRPEADRCSISPRTASTF